MQDCMTAGINDQNCSLHSDRHHRVAGRLCIVTGAIQVFKRYHFVWCTARIVPDQYCKMDIDQDNRAKQYSNKEKENHTVIAGTAEEYEEAFQIFKEAGLHQSVLGRVAINGEEGNAIGSWKQLDQLSATVPFREIIFCEGNTSFRHYQSNTKITTATGCKNPCYGSQSIVGSDSKDTSGESVSKENGYKLSDPYNRV